MVGRFINPFKNTNAEDEISQLVAEGEALLAEEAALQAAPEEQELAFV